jgi:hypothetical protein
LPRRSLLGTSLIAAVLALGACSATPTPTPEAEVCSPDLPPRTSPTDYPVAVLHVAGDDLPPVVGGVEWLGGDEPVAYEPERAVHLQAFTVLQTRGRGELSLRMSDGVEIASWTVDVVPGPAFRRGDFDTDRVRWAEGSTPESIVCVPMEDGEWGVIADITFADDAGHGTYYWRLNVVDAPPAA